LQVELEQELQAANDTIEELMGELETLRGVPGDAEPLNAQVTFTYHDGIFEVKGRGFPSTNAMAQAVLFSLAQMVGAPRE